MAANTKGKSPFYPGQPVPMELFMAADEVGKKYVDQQVYKALRSADDHSILKKIAKMGPDQMSFTKAEVSSGLNLDLGLKTYR